MKSHTKLFLFTTLDCDDQFSKFVKINSGNPLYLIINEVNGYSEEMNGNKYFTLVPTNGTKEKIKKNINNYGVTSKI